MEVLSRSMLITEEVKIEKETETEGVMIHPISSLGVDSYQTIVWFAEVEWKGDTYKYSTRAGRPVPVLYEHGGGFFTMDREPLGRSIDIQIKGDGKSADTTLVAKSQFDLEDGRARERFRKHKMGYVNGWSIGFIPGRVLRDEQADEFLKEQGREERGISVILSPELWEYSSVLYPANVDTYDNKSREILTELVNRTLREMGNPTHEEIKELQLKVMELEARIQQPVISQDEPLLPILRDLKGVNNE